MDYLTPIIIIEKTEGDDLLPAGFMAEWCGPPESVPKGWRVVDKEDLFQRLLGEE